jgi:hypothetical protein
MHATVEILAAGSGAPLWIAGWLVLLVLVVAAAVHLARKRRG